jgi:hypothetical protein
VLFSQYTPVYERGKAFYGGTIVVKFLDPIETTGLSADDTQMLLDKTHDIMNTELKRISFVPGKTYIWHMGAGGEQLSKQPEIKALEMEDLEQLVKRGGKAVDDLQEVEGNVLRRRNS